MEPSPSSDDDLTRRIETGEYFAHARRWYELLYIAPISQRITFIIVASLAVCFMLMAVVSVMNLLPLSPRIPFVIHNANYMELLPSIHRFKKPQEPADPALIRYYLTTYVQKREGYNARRMLLNRAFVLQYSLPEVARLYAQEISQNNPQSPVRRYGQQRDLEVIVHGVRVLASATEAQSPKLQAEIDFSTIVTGDLEEPKTDWTATITFEYTHLTVRNTYDEAQGDYVLDFDAPSFKVLGYQRRERLARNMGQ